MFKNLEDIFDSNIEVIRKSFNKIVHLCIENKSIADFVNAITNPEDPLNHELLVLVSQLGYSIDLTSYNSCSPICELSSFLSNINDDFYFYVKQNDRGLFNAYGEDIQLPDKVTQDVNFLMEAARNNVKYYETKEHKRIARLQNIVANFVNDSGC